MSISNEFQLFRTSHPVVHRNFGGHDWNFVIGGSGARTVVILPGGGGDAESMFPVVAGLGQRYRVIAIGYPATASTANDLVDGVSAVLDNCGVRSITLLGHSLGGMVARVFAAKYPERVDALIIANSALYTPGRRLLLSVSLPIMAHLPQGVLAGAIRSGFRRLLKNQPDQEFWLGYVNQCQMMSPNSPGLRNQARCMYDFVRHWNRPPPLSGAAGTRVLILESDKETGFTVRERQIFRSFYPRAAVHVLTGAGHASFITHTRDFVEVVDAFLGSADPAR